MSAVPFIITGLLPLCLAALALIWEKTRSPYQLWLASRPGDQASLDEAQIRIALARLSRICSESVISGADWEKAADHEISITQELLGPLGRTYQKIVRSLDLEDLLFPEAKALMPAPVQPLAQHGWDCREYQADMKTAFRS